MKKKISYFIFLALVLSPARIFCGTSFFPENPARISCAQLWHSILLQEKIGYHVDIDEEYEEMLEPIYKRFYESGVTSFYQSGGERLVAQIQEISDRHLMEMIDQPFLFKVEVGPSSLPICADCYYVEPQIERTIFGTIKAKIDRSGLMPSITQPTFKNSKYWIKGDIKDLPFRESSVDLFILKHFPLYYTVTDQEVKNLLHALFIQLKRGGEAIFMNHNSSEIPFESGMWVLTGPYPNGYPMAMINGLPAKHSVAVSLTRVFLLAEEMGFSVQPFVSDWYSGLFLQKI